MQEMLINFMNNIEIQNKLYEKYSKNELNTDNYLQKKKYFFIVGMPRSGSTLVESIISQNDNVFDLGETEALPFSYGQWVNNQRGETLFEIYKVECRTNTLCQNQSSWSLFNNSFAWFFIWH